MNFKELSELISEQVFTLKRVLGNSAAPGRVIDQTKNILYNHVEEIEAALKYASEAEKKISILEVELGDAERELDELNKAGKKTAKKKATGDTNE